MAIIFLNRFFYPDHSATSQLLSDLAFEQDSEGHDVCVITSRQRYDDPQIELPPLETIRGVKVYRVATTRFGRHALLGRAIDYLTYYVSAAFKLLLLVRKGDIVVAKTDPPMMSVLVSPICWLRRARLVNWLQDVFPEVAQELGVGRGAAAKFAYGIMRFLRDRSLRSADVNAVLGERMSEKLISLGVRPDRIVITPNWADENIHPVEREANALRQQWGLSDAFVVGYSGNLGRAHEYDTLLDAIALVEVSQQQDTGSSALDIAWLFIGGGALFETFKAAVAERHLKSVRFDPYQPRERLSESLSAADVHLVSLLPEMEGLIVPSKFYGIAAAGRPTIFIGDHDGEIARILSKHSCGLTVPVKDGAALAQAVLKLASDPDAVAAMGQRARALSEESYSFAKAMGRWRAIFDRLDA